MRGKLAEGLANGIGGVGGGMHEKSSRKIYEEGTSQSSQRIIGGEESSGEGKCIKLAGWELYTHDEEGKECWGLRLISLPKL